MTTPRPRLIFHPVTPDRWTDVEALFGKNGGCAGCWCQFFKLPNAQFRSGLGSSNRAAFRRSVMRGEVPGLLAYTGDEPVGWVAVEPRARFKRLASSRILPVVDERPTWSIPCFFVPRGWRGQGVAGGLLAAAVAHARASGAPAVEGYPVDSTRTLDAPSLYHGAFSTFVKAGFAEVARKSKTRPLVRLELSRPGRARARSR
jgi:GNAT superfamily N-acetyltransferase